MDGVIVVDKPRGLTSHDVVDRVRKALGVKSVGHAGTLDPLATGVLVLLVGAATKLSKYLTSQDKTYLAEFTLGLSSESWDIDTEMSLFSNSTDLKCLKEEQVSEVIKELQGVLLLPVPLFSAVKVNGQRLYKYSRKKQDVDLPIRPMNFYSTKMLGFGFEECIISEKSYSLPRVQVKLHCQKGSYIRSWGRALGEKLGTQAVMSSLRRLSSGNFDVSGSITLNNLLEIISENKPSHLYLRDIHSFLKGSFYRLGSKELMLIQNGQLPFELMARLGPELRQAYQSGQPSLAKLIRGSSNDLVGVVEVPHQGRPKLLSLVVRS